MDFYKAYGMPRVALVDIGRNPDWCVASWDCKFTLFRHSDAGIILDVESLNCIRIIGNGLRLQDLYVDTNDIFVCGYLLDGRYYGLFLSFDKDLELKKQRRFYGSPDLLLHRIVGINDLLYASGKKYDPYTGVIYGLDKDFNVIESYGYGGTSLYVGSISSNVVAGVRSDRLLCLDNTVSVVDFSYSRSSNNVLATKSKFLLDKLHYYTITEADSAITPAWFFSPTRIHACCGSYVVRLDPANDFTVIKALYTTEYDLFGCSDTMFVGKHKESGKIAIIDATQGIESLAMLDSFTETTVSTSKTDNSWKTLSLPTASIYKTSSQLTISDGNCVEVTS